MAKSMMIYTSLPILLWGYSLQIVAYILNVVPSKFVLKTLVELLMGHINLVCTTSIYRDVQYKCLNRRSERWKESKEDLHYNNQENKAYMSTNIIFFEQDYINNNKPHSKVFLKENEFYRIKQPPPIDTQSTNKS